MHMYIYIYIYAKIKNIEDEIPDITNLAIKLLLMLLKIKYLVLVIQSKKTEYKTKNNEIEKKITDHNHVKYVATTEFNKLTSGNIEA